MSDIKINNKSFNELVHYIDHDLADVLTDEQSDRLYGLAVSSIATDMRHSTRRERAEQILPGLVYTYLDTESDSESIKGGWVSKNFPHLLSSIIGAIIIITIAFTV